jgi:hypothetical protein
VDKSYQVTWSKTGIDELAGILAYPTNVKERILDDSFHRLSHSPTLTAKQIRSGPLEGYWVRHGLYQVMLIFRVDEQCLSVHIDGIKHKAQDVYWKRGQ